MLGHRKNLLLKIEAKVVILQKLFLLKPEGIVPEASSNDEPAVHCGNRTTHLKELSQKPAAMMNLLSTVATELLT